MTDKEIEEFKQMYLDPKVKIKNIYARFFITESKVRYLANKYGLNSNRKDLKSEMIKHRRKSEAADYDAGMLIKDIASKYGITYDACRQDLIFMKKIKEDLRTHNDFSVPTIGEVKRRATNPNKPTELTHTLVLHYYLDDTSSSKNAYHRKLTHDETMRDIAYMLGRSIEEIENILKVVLRGVRPRIWIFMFGYVGILKLNEVLKKGK